MNINRRDNFSEHSAERKGFVMTPAKRQWIMLAALFWAGLFWAEPGSAAATTIDFDAATVADLNAAFTAGSLTSEKLVRLCLARIAAYDHQGPSLNAVLAVNPKALEIARALDAERKAKGPRSPLHGIPVVLKDNYNLIYAWGQACCRG
jgi:amidase